MAQSSANRDPEELKKIVDHYEKLLHEDIERNVKNRRNSDRSSGYSDIRRNSFRKGGKKNSSAYSRAVARRKRAAFNPNLEDKHKFNKPGYENQISFQTALHKLSTEQTRLLSSVSLNLENFSHDNSPSRSRLKSINTEEQSPKYDKKSVSISKNPKIIK